LPRRHTTARLYMRRTRVQCARHGPSVTPMSSTTSSATPHGKADRRYTASGDLTLRQVLELPALLKCACICHHHPDDVLETCSIYMDGSNYRSITSFPQRACGRVFYVFLFSFDVTSSESHTSRFLNTTHNSTPVHTSRTIQIQEANTHPHECP
jgi:hypothetical protein